MKNNQIVSSLENWYCENIYPVCPKLSKCQENCQSFSKKPKMCYIGKEYGNSSEIPNLVLVSLDSGSQDEINPLYTINQIRNNVEERAPQIFEKNKHWYQTFDLAKIILSPFIIDSIKNSEFLVNPYIVHTNSAKCTQNKSGNAIADDRLFDNCREYVITELELLKPKIVITQGSKADIVLNHFKEIDRIEFKLNNKQLLIIIRVINNVKVVHIHTYHPSYYRGYWAQKEIIVNNVEVIAKLIKEVSIT